MATRVRSLVAFLIMQRQQESCVYANILPARQNIRSYRKLFFLIICNLPLRQIQSEEIKASTIRSSNFHTIRKITQLIYNHIEGCNTNLIMRNTVKAKSRQLDDAKLRVLYSGQNGELHEGVCFYCFICLVVGWLPRGNEGYVG